jgi:hypothetical protein
MDGCMVIDKTFAPLNMNIELAMNIVMMQGIISMMMKIMSGNGAETGTLLIKALKTLSPNVCMHNLIKAPEVYS